MQGFLQCIISQDAAKMLSASMIFASMSWNYCVSDKFLDADYFQIQ